MSITTERMAKRSQLWINLPRKARSYTETMVMNLWLHEEPEGYSLLQEAYTQKYNKDDYECAEWLKNQMHHRLWIETIEACLWSDLMMAAFSRVNWLEIIRINRR